MELREQLDHITFNFFSFKIPFGFPPTMMLGRLGCVHYVLSVLEKSLNAGGKPFLKERATTELQVMNYKTQPDSTLYQVLGERSKGLKKSGSETSVSFTASCPKNWIVSTGDRISFDLHLKNPFPLKKQIKNILITVLQTHKTAEGSDMKWTLQKFRYPYKDDENTGDKTVNVSFVTDFSNSFVPTYTRKRGWYAICHSLKITVAVHGGSDIVSLLPISIYDKKPTQDVEEILSKVRPDWPNERVIFPIFQQRYETPVSFCSTGGRL